MNQYYLNKIRGRNMHEYLRLPRRNDVMIVRYNKGNRVINGYITFEDWNKYR